LHEGLKEKGRKDELAGKGKWKRAILTSLSNDPEFITGELILRKAKGPREAGRACCHNGKVKHYSHLPSRKTRFGPTWGSKKNRIFISLGEEELEGGRDER